MRNNKGQFIKGFKQSEETKRKISLFQKSRTMSLETCKKISISNKGKKKSLIHSQNISNSKKGKKLKWSLEGIKSFKEKMSGKNNPKWVEDRTQLQKYGDDNKDRRSSLYREWRKEVYKRDSWKCKINNKDCNGRIEAHHILGYTENPELRYDINNGITLCHFHHPRKRIEEINMSPYFQSLVAEFK